MPRARKPKTAATETLLMTVDGYDRTAREAAEHFAETYWPRPRPIAGWDGDRFYLAEGILWYRVAADGMNWAILRTTDACP